MTRTANIHLTSDEVTTAMETATPAVFWAALGYLSTWSMSYPTCNIYADGTITSDHPDFFAVYQDDAGNTKYTIGAVWNGSSYGFHS